MGPIKIEPIKIEPIKIEESPAVDPAQRLYRVSRILPRIINRVQLPQEPARSGLCRTGVEALSPLWGNRDNESVEQWRELFRLTFGDKDNPQRFRAGFL